MSHVTTVLAVCCFLLVVSLNRLSRTFFDISTFEDIRIMTLTFCGYVTSSGSCDVISHVTIGLAIYGFLLVVSLNRPSILHSFKILSYKYVGIMTLGT